MLTAALFCLLATPDLSIAERFPAPADLVPGRPLAWDAASDTVLRLESFDFERGGLRVSAGPSTLLVGGGPQGAVWAALVPDDPGQVAGELPGAGEPLAHCYLRFHPAEVDRLFPPPTVTAVGATWRRPAGYRLALAKLRSSWQSNGRPVVPMPGTVVLDCGTAEVADTAGPGRRRFYMAEGAADPAYFADFEGQALPRDVAIGAPAALAGLESAWSRFDQVYAMFALRDLDWAAAREPFAAWSEAIDTEWELGLAIQRLIEPLGDRHASVQVGQEILVSDVSSPDYRANFQAVMGALGPMTQPRQGINWGRTPDGFGYLSVSALDRADLVQHFDRALTDLADAKGMVLDLRFNTGGDETLARQLAGRFAPGRTVYAKHRFRAEGGGLGPWQERAFEPRGERVLLPLRVLIGPEVMSSAEAFALMFAALPEVRLIGATTAGSTGNPAPWELTDNVRVFVPRWLAARPDHTPIEGVGVPPDRVVDPGPAAFANADPVFEAALEELSEAVR